MLILPSLPEKHLLNAIWLNKILNLLHEIEQYNIAKMVI